MIKNYVIAITVTYNRTSTLRMCLESILQQSRPVDKIIVVDNNSNIKEKQNIKELVADKDNIDVIWLSENRGGAGGFEAGMEDAFKRYRPDWYWLMDDDAYPDKDCLENLLNQSSNLINVGGLCPVIYGVDLKKYQLFHHKKLSKLIYKNIPIAKKYDQLNDVQKIQANAFVGPLISSKAVEAVGFADGSLFIYGDDTEYTYRISRLMGIYLIKKAIIRHQDAPVLDQNMNPAAWWKEYYGNRNSFFMIKEFHHNYIIRYLAYGCLILRLGAIMVKSQLKGYHRLRNDLIIKAIRDGITNRRGKTLDPQKYSRQVKRLGIGG